MNTRPLFSTSLLSVSEGFNKATQGILPRSTQQYDLIFDLARNRSLSELRHVLTPNGTLVVSAGEAVGGSDPSVSR